MAALLPEEIPASQWKSSGKECKQTLKSRRYAASRLWRHVVECPSWNFFHSTSGSVKCLTNSTMVLSLTTKILLEVVQQQKRLTANCDVTEMWTRSTVEILLTHVKLFKWALLTTERRRWNKCHYKELFLKTFCECVGLDDITELVLVCQWIEINEWSSIYVIGFHFENYV